MIDSKKFKTEKIIPLTRKTRATIYPVASKYADIDSIECAVSVGIIFIN